MASMGFRKDLILSWSSRGRWRSGFFSRKRCFEGLAIVEVRVPVFVVAAIVANADAGCVDLACIVSGLLSSENGSSYIVIMTDLLVLLLSCI